jgi:hypothetical protein
MPTPKNVIPVLSKPFTVLFLLVLCLPFHNSSAQEVERITFSLRTGFPVNSNDKGFRQYEIFSDFRLPVVSQSRSGWIFNLRLDAVASLLEESGEQSFLLSVGPAFMLTKAGGRLALKLGSSPTYLSDPKFPKKDLGGSFHFISHIGVTLRVARNLSLIYRIQHLSNASIVQPNPGLNLHVLGLGVGSH